MHAVVCRSDKYTHITWQVIQGSPGRVHQDGNPRVAGKRCFRCVCLVRSWRLHLLHASACARPIASLPRTCELPHARCARRSSAGTGRSDGFLQWLNPLPVQSVAHGAEWWTGGGLVHMGSAHLDCMLEAGFLQGLDGCTIACARLARAQREAQPRLQTRKRQCGL